MSIKPGLEGKAAEDAFGFFLTTGFLGHEIIPSSFKHLTEVSKLRAPWVLCFFFFFSSSLLVYTLEVKVSSFAISVLLGEDLLAQGFSQLSPLNRLEPLSCLKHLQQM